MKKLVLFLAIPLMLTTTGCFEILEEIYLEKGGSGTYKLTMDMSALMDESLQEMLSGMGGDEGMQNLKDTEIDSIIDYKDINPEAVSALSRPEVFENARMRMEISDLNDVLRITMMLDFETLDDIDYFMEHMSTVAGDDFGAGLGAGLLPQNSNFLSLKGKKLTRHKVETTETPAFSEEERAMAEMMFSEATYTTIYHFPGKVKKSSIPDSEISGNTVTVQRGLMDMLDESADISGTIKFKWK